MTARDWNDMEHHYTLIGQTPVEEPDFLLWAAWYEQADRIVAQDQIGDVLVSTVFLGRDHNFFGDGPPLLFETTVFEGPEDGACWRRSTWLEAEVQHARALAKVNE